MGVRVGFLTLLDDGNRVDRLRKAAVEVRESPCRLVALAEKRVSADQMQPVVPKVRPRLDRTMQPANGFAVSFGVKIRAAKDPVKNADGRVVRAEPQRLFDTYRRFRRSPDKRQLAALMGIGKREIRIELDRPAECLQRRVMLASRAIDEAIREMRQR